VGDGPHEHSGRCRTGWRYQLQVDKSARNAKHGAMGQLSAVGVPAGAVFDSMELTNEPSFRQRGILQTMTHGERTMTMPTWPVRFDGVPTAVKSAPLLGEHTDVMAIHHRAIGNICTLSGNRGAKLPLVWLARTTARG